MEQLVRSVGVPNGGRLPQNPRVDSSWEVIAADALCCCADWTGTRRIDHRPPPNPPAWWPWWCRCCGRSAQRAATALSQSMPPSRYSRSWATASSISRAFLLAQMMSSLVLRLERSSRICTSWARPRLSLRLHPVPCSLFSVRRRACSQTATGFFFCSATVAQMLGCGPKCGPNGHDTP